MSGPRFLTEGERAALREIGDRFLAELRPILETEGIDPADVDNFAYELVAEAVGCIFTTLKAQAPQPNLCAIFTGVGLQLGRVYGQQDDELQPYLDDALERALEVGMRQAEAMRSMPPPRKADA